MTRLMIAGASVAGAAVLAAVGAAAAFAADVPFLYRSRVAAVEKRFHDKRPQGAVLLTGSSFIERWATSEHDLAPLDTINVGIGGTKIGDQAAYVDRLVLVFRPRAVVIYAGSNDINGAPIFSKKAADVAPRVQRYLEYLHGALPSAPLFYIAITEAPQRERVRGEIQEANRLIAEFAASTDYVTFIDTAPTLLTETGEIDRSLFGDDTLHFNEAGYARFASAVRPVLLEALADGGGA